MSHLHNKRYLFSWRKYFHKLDSTAAESSLWKLLKNKQISELKFRRQHSIGNYIVDFYCPEIRLIIELDGASHDNYLSEGKDEIRDAYLRKHKFTILRFENKTVYNYPGDIIDSILNHKKIFNE